MFVTCRVDSLVQGTPVGSLASTNEPIVQMNDSWLTVFTVCHLNHWTELRSIISLANHNYTVDVLRAPYGAAAYHAKVVLLADVLGRLDPGRTILFVDAFDTYARHTMRTMVRRYRAHYAPSTVFATERVPGHISAGAELFYRTLAPIYATNKFINTGMFIGKAGSVQRLLSSCATHPSLRQGTRLRTDQTAIGETIASDRVARMNVVLDYTERLFYTASGPHWSLAVASAHIRAVDPVMVHVPFTQAPRVNRTYYGLYDGEHGRPWPEANFTYCTAQEALCAREPSAAGCHVGPGHRPGLTRIMC